MTPAEHLAKAQVVLASLYKLTFPGDYLAIVDGAMIAGYHLGNALLHEHGVLPDDAHANTPSKLERPIDSLPPAIQMAFRAFAELERLRFEYVRSPSRYDAGLERRVWDLLKEMQQVKRRAETI
ncbi:MAG: hypothetical protein K2Y16_00330 [Burkholderiales bacterium]|nr:hypothetical protein [Burkholderiales bacterium]